MTRNKMKGKIVLSLVIILGVGILFVFAHKADYDKTIESYSDEIRECFPEKIPKEAEKTKVKENSLC